MRIMIVFFTALFGDKSTSRLVFLWAFTLKICFHFAQFNVVCLYVGLLCVYHLG